MVCSDYIQIEKTPRPFLSTDSPDLSDYLFDRADNLCNLMNL